MKWFLLFFLLLLPAVADADRDIVYAARYYNPPGSHRTSHFHLYRIDPDGTGRRQLTYGESDDDCPLWSPDGRHILFLRGEGMVCMADADGREVRRLANFGGIDFVVGLRWLPDGRTVSFVHYHYVRVKTGLGLKTTNALLLMDSKTGDTQRFPEAMDGVGSPRGKWLLVQDGNGARIVNRYTGASSPLPPTLDGSAWLGDGRLVGHDDETPLMLHIFNADRKVTASLTMRPPKPNLWDLAEGYGGFLPSPQPGTVIYVLNEHNSTVGAQGAFFRVNLTDGAMRFLAQGQFLAWSPDGKRFCTAPGRDTWTYHERKWDGAYKTVWAAPLQVGTVGGKLKSITPGLVWVTGADWRKR